MSESVFDATQMACDRDKEGNLDQPLLSLDPGADG